MDTAPRKYCSRCQREYPATTDYFYPSYLKENSRNECKVCHKKRRGKNPPKSDSIREKLIEIAQPIQQAQLSSYRTFNAIAQCIGCTQKVVGRDAYNSKKPVFKLNYHQHGIALALTREDAEAYIASKNHQEPKQVTPVSGSSVENVNSLEQVPQQTIGTSSQCGACGTTEGNIICDVDKITRAWRGYLCTPCYRLARLIRDCLQGDPQRIHSTLIYVEQTSDIQ